MLSTKPADWVAEVAATPEVLVARESIAVVQHALSKATSRKPQGFLFEAVRDRLATAVADPVSARIVAMLGDYGTVKTVGELCEELGKIKPLTLLQCDHASTVVASIARRVDEGKGFRNTFLGKIAAAITPANFASHAGVRRVVAALAVDATYGPVVAKTLQAKTVRAFLATEVINARPLPDMVAFVVDVVTSSAKSGDAGLIESVCDAVNTAIEPLMKPEAAHRPRPEILSALARASPERVAAAICRAAAQWRDLSKQVSGPLAESLAHAAQHAPTADAEVFAAKVATVAPLHILVTRCTFSARLVVVLRKLGLVKGLAGSAAEAAIDAVEDTLNCQSSSCAAASRTAAQRAIERLGSAPAARDRRSRPTIAVVESDDEEDSAKPKARKSARAEATKARR